MVLVFYDSSYRYLIHDHLIFHISQALLLDHYGQIEFIYILYYIYTGLIIIYLF